MSNTSLELDCARAILKTYHQVHDAPHTHQQTKLRASLHRKNKELENELSQMKEKYLQLQAELQSRDQNLAHLNKQLKERTSHITRLQEDFENAIYQMTKMNDTKGLR